MKAQISMLLFLIFLSVEGAFAQGIIIRQYVEKTHVNLKAGTAIGFIDKYQFEYGAFYQKSDMAESLLMSQDAKNNLPRFYEKSFGGLFFSAPIVLRESFDVKLNVRTGVSNGENFVITPSIVAGYDIAPIVRFSAGIGTRAFRPTWQAMIALKLK